MRKMEPKHSPKYWNRFSREVVAFFWRYLKLDQGSFWDISPNCLYFERELNPRSSRFSFWTRLLNWTILIESAVSHVWEMRLVRKMCLTTIFVLIGQFKRWCIKLTDFCSDIWSFDFLFSFTLFPKATSGKPNNDNNFIALTHLPNHISSQKLL